MPNSHDRKRKSANKGGSEDTRGQQNSPGGEEEKKGVKRLQERAPEGQSHDNQIVSLVLLLLLAALIGVAIYRQVATPTVKEDDIPTLDKYLNEESDGESDVSDDALYHDNDGGEKNREEKRHAGHGDDYVDEEGYDDEEDSPEAEDNDREKGFDPFTDMEPTDPMEEDLPFEVGQMPDANSFMRPHVGPKMDYWKKVTSLLKGNDKVKYLHQNPDLILVRDFLTAAECMQLIQVHERIASKHEDPPTWCFSNEEWLEGMLADENLTSKVTVFSLDDELGKARACVKVS